MSVRYGTYSSAEENWMRKNVALAALVAGVVFASKKLLRPHDDERRLDHTSETELVYRNARTRILILGAGFGGLATALELDQKLKAANDVSILVVDRNNDLLFTPLLWTVANGRAHLDDVIVPIRDFQRGRRFHVLHAEVECIDLDLKELQMSNGWRPYNILVISLS